MSKLAKLKLITFGLTFASLLALQTTKAQAEELPAALASSYAESSTVISTTLEPKSKSKAIRLDPRSESETDSKSESEAMKNTDLKLVSNASAGEVKKDLAVSAANTKIDFYEFRKKSDAARTKIESFGLTIKTQIDSSHYVVAWDLSDLARSDGNMKDEFEIALTEYKTALEAERDALHKAFGVPKTQNEVIFAADTLGRLELVAFTLDSSGSVPSFNAYVGWSLRSHAVITLPEQCEDCSRNVLIVKLEHFDPTHFDWNMTSIHEVVHTNITTP